MVTKDSLQAPQQKPAKARRNAAATQAVRELTGPTTLTALVATAQKLLCCGGWQGRPEGDGWGLQGGDPVG